MAITHATSLRNTFADAVTADVDGGGGAGKMVLKTSTTSVSTIPFNSPSFGAAANGVITLDVTPTPEDTNATGNASAVDSFELQDNASAVVITGAVPGDLTLSKNPIDAGDTVQITSFTYTASA